MAVIRCTLDRAHGNRAAFVRNEQMMKLGLHALVATPGNGITENLVGLAREQIPHPGAPHRHGAGRGRRGRRAGRVSARIRRARHRTSSHRVAGTGG